MGNNMPNYKSFDDYYDYSLNNMFGEPVAETPTETAAEMAFRFKNELTENQPVVKNIPQSTFEKGLESAGIKIEQAGKFLESLGSVNIGGVNLTLRDLMPIDEPTSEALKLLGSGMPLTTGKGLTTTVKPEIGEAIGELSLLGPASVAIGNVASRIGKRAMKNKAKLTTGTATIAASEATKQKASE
jgi:hypothetical protein